MSRRPRPTIPTIWAILTILALILGGCGTASATRAPAEIAPTPDGGTNTATPEPGTTTTPTALLVATPTGTIVVTIAASPAARGESGGAWATAGSLTAARSAHTASLLPGGRVLVVGGSEAARGASGGTLARAAIYDPAQNRWDDAASLTLARTNHTATVLPDGRVLVVGGDAAQAGRPEAQPSASVEVFDPGTNTWRDLSAAPAPRSGHTATLLADGMVLVVGGQAGEASGATGGQSLASAAVYNPADNTWTAVASLAKGRQGHTATVLPDGRVLVVGGETRATDGSLERASSVEIYDPVTRTWSATGSLATGRSGHTATLLTDGTVLVVGGQTDATRGAGVQPIAAGRVAAAPASSAERFDPQTGTWTPVAPLSTERAAHTATLLPGGLLLVVGGYGRDGTTPVATAERYDPAANRWTSVAAPTARAGHTATLLPDGAVLVVGGIGTGGTPLATAERYGRPAAPAPSAAASPSASPSPEATPETPVVPPSGAPSAAPRPTSTNTPTPTRTTVPIPGATATNTPTPAPMPIPSAAPTETGVPTATPTATRAAATATATQTPTPRPTPTNTPLPPTSTPTNTPTKVPTPTPTPVPPTNTPTRTPTNTPIPPGAVSGVTSFCPNRQCSAQSGVTVAVAGRSTTSGSGGFYSISSLPAGTYTITASYYTGVTTYSTSATVTIVAGKTTSLNLAIYCCNVN